MRVQIFRKNHAPIIHNMRRQNKPADVVQTDEQDETNIPPTSFAAVQKVVRLITSPCSIQHLEIDSGLIVTRDSKQVTLL